MNETNDDNYALSGEIKEELLAEDEEPKNIKELRELQKKVKNNPEPLNLKNPVLEEPEPLNIDVPIQKLHSFKTNDYITFRCNLCNAEVTHAKKDDDNQFVPWALCQHVIFKGLVAEK